MEPEPEPSQDLEEIFTNDIEEDPPPKAKRPAWLVFSLAPGAHRP